MDVSKEVLEYLNAKTGRKYRETKHNLTFIRGRLEEEGVTVEGVKQMISRQVARWKGTDQSEFLRPETLFNPTKFDAYYAARELPIEVGSRDKPRLQAEDRTIQDMQRLL